MDRDVDLPVVMRFQTRSGFGQEPTRPHGLDALIAFLSLNASYLVWSRPVDIA
jgi:hypothetical protein